MTGPPDMCSCAGGPCDEAVCHTPRRETLRLVGRVGLDRTDLDLSCILGCDQPGRCWPALSRRCHTRPAKNNSISKWLRDLIY